MNLDADVACGLMALGIGLSFVVHMASWNRRQLGVDDSVGELLIS